MLPISIWITLIGKNFLNNFKSKIKQTVYIQYIICRFLLRQYLNIDSSNSFNLVTIFQFYLNILHFKLLFFSSFIKDNLCLLLISTYINRLSKSYGNEVISIKKESLQKIQHINVMSSSVNGKVNCNFQLSHGFNDLSQIKSIGKLIASDNILTYCKYINY